LRALARPRQLRGRLGFAFCVNDLGSALALRLRLARDSRRCICSGMSTCLTSTFVTLIPQGSVSWSRMTCNLLLTFSRSARIASSSKLADDAAQRGLRLLRSRVEIILHLGQRKIRVHHAEIGHGVYFYRDVVSRNNVLRGTSSVSILSEDPVERLNRPERQCASRGPWHPAAYVRDAARRRAPIP